MSWKRHFSPVNTNSVSNVSPISGSSSAVGPAKKNYSSYLPDVYTGSPNRIERYMQYDTMDIDSEVNAALDILAEFCTQKNKENQTPFTLYFKGRPTNSEIKILKEYLQQWTKLQLLETRMFRVARNLFKYGDGIFIRDPETQKLFYIDPGKIVKIIVNESEGKKPEQYVIRDLNVNFMHLVTTQINPNTQNTTPGGAAYVQGGSGARGMTGAYPQQVGTRFSIAQNEFAIDAKHVVHLSLSEGLDNNYPFGNSLLESVFKVYKQKELLEDAIIIYRVQRAPERRVFYIDVGNMPIHLAMGFVERVKNEIHQRRIPSSQGGGQSVIDSSYNPLCLDLQTKIPLLDGRTLELTQLISEFESGKENWTYSCDPNTGKIVPGVINWAGITRKNTEVIKLTFDNGKELICTPDHKIPVFGKGFVEAKDLILDDKLITFDQQELSIWDHTTSQYELVENVVGQFFKEKQKHQESTYLTQFTGQDKTILYHKNFNNADNCPQNLMFMNSTDYTVLMNTVTDEFWKNNIDYIGSISTFDKDEWKAIGPNHRLNEIFDICEYLDVDKLTLTNVIKENTQYTHIPVKLVKIETVEKRDTGTITIDGTEQWHDYHTFAIESGIFVKNSINEDYFFPQTCLALDQTIKLLDGRDLQLIDIINEYEEGKENWAYAINQETHIIEPGKIVWAGKTRLNTQLVEVLLDNGEKIKVTPDHRFIMRDGSEVEAQYLNENDSLMPLYLHDATTGKHQQAGKYLKYTCNATGKKKWVHTMVCPKTKLGKKTESATKVQYALANTRKKVSAAKTIQYSDAMCGRVVELYNQGVDSISKLSNVLRTDKIFQTYFIEANPNLLRDKNRPNILLPTDKTLVKIAQHLGYKGWSDFKQNYQYNHKVVSVVWLEEFEDTGDITIESASGAHNFALTSGVFIHNSEGRGSKVETLPGGTNLGEIDDLKYFTNKLMRALRIPSSYLPTGADDSQAQYNDGRVGTAYIQELRFNKYCERLQSLMIGTFDTEFKLFLYNKGVNIDFSLFDLKFQSPQNFASYRQAELDNQRIGTFSQMAALPFVAKRFALKRFLGLSDEDVAENERMWKEENGETNAVATDASGELRTAGVTPSGIDGDLNMAAGTEEMPDDMTAPGEEPAPTPPAGAMPQ